MELIDFKYWLSLNENELDENGPVTKIFTFSSDFDSIISNKYYQIAVDTLEEASRKAGFEYSINRSTHGEIEITFNKLEDDEIFSLVYGDFESASIKLRGPHSIDTKAILLYIRKRMSSRYLAYEKLESGDTVVRLNIPWAKQYINFIKNAAFDLAKGKLTYSPIENDDVSISINPPADKDYINALDDSRNSIYSKKETLDHLTESLNEYITYMTAKFALDLCISDVSIDINELRNDIDSKAEKFISIDLDSLSDEEKKKTLSEIFKFLSYLISISNKLKIERHAASFALAKIFRILIKQYGSVLKVASALKSEKFQ